MAEYTQPVVEIEGANSPGPTSTRRMSRGHAAAIAEAQANAMQWRAAYLGGFAGGTVGAGAGLLLRRRAGLGHRGVVVAAAVGALTGSLSAGSMGWRRGYRGAWRHIGYDPSTGYT